MKGITKCFRLFALVYDNVLEGLSPRNDSLRHKYIEKPIAQVTRNAFNS